MKKIKNYFVLGMSLALLCSCGGSSSSTSSNDGSSISSSKDSTSVHENFNDVFASFEDGNMTVYNDIMDTTTYYYGPDAVYREYNSNKSSSYGYMTMSNEGMFSFVLDNDKVNIKNTLSLSDSDHASLMLYSPSLISDNASFKQKNGVWTSTHENTLQMFAYIAGLGSNLSSTNGQTVLLTGTMTGKENGDGSLTFSYSFESTSYTFSYVLTISSIGSTHNKTIESFQKAGKMKDPETDWNATQKALITNVTGDKVLPYPTGTSAYTAFSYGSNLISFTDYGSNASNMPEQYKAQLEAAGFSLNSSRSSLDGTDPIYLYEMDKQVEDLDNGKAHVTYEIVFGYTGVSSTTASRYPNGKFIVNFKLYQYTFKPTSVDSLNAFIKNTFNSDSVLPSFSFSATPSSMYAADQTQNAKESYETLGYTASFDHYFVFGIAFESNLDCASESSSYQSLLLASGFKKGNSSDGTTTYTKEVDGYENGITISVATQSGTSSSSPWIDIEVAW